MKAFLVLAALAASSSAASAATQFSSSLRDISGSAFGTTVSTTTDQTGRRTTANNPFVASARYSDAAAPKDVWQAQNVGRNGVAGITTDFARSGNGSAFFSGVDGNSKADLEIRFSQAIALSSLTSMSYDMYRDASSTAPAHLTNSLRLMVGNAAGVFTNTYLIFEPVYNGFPVATPVAENTWYTFDITGASTVWANNGNLSEPAGTAACNACYAPLSAWQASNPNLTIIGLSTGIGSGFSGTYKGAVDNISMTAGGITTTTNFEVVGVPEPASWAMMIGGFAFIGAAARRRTTKVVFA